MTAIINTHQLYNNISIGFEVSFRHLKPLPQARLGVKLNFMEGGGGVLAARLVWSTLKEAKVNTRVRGGGILTEKFP